MPWFSYFPYANFLYRDNVAKKSNPILIKLTFFETGKESEFQELIKDSAYGFYI